MNAETIENVPVSDAPTDVDSGSSPMPTGSDVAFGVWTRDIDALCRALDAQQRVHFSRAPAEEK